VFVITLPRIIFKAHMKATMMEEQVVAVLEQDNQQIKREMLERAKENVTRILWVAFALTAVVVVCCLLLMWLVGQPVGLALADSSSCLWFSFVVELLVELVWQWDGTYKVAYLGFFHRWFVERRLSCNKDLIALSPAALGDRCELKGSVAEPVATDSAKFFMASLSNWVMFTYVVTITALWHGHSGILPTTLFLAGNAVTFWTLWRGHCDINDPFVCTVGIYMLIGILAGRLVASEVAMAGTQGYLPSICIAYVVVSALLAVGRVLVWDLMSLLPSLLGRVTMILNSIHGSSKAEEPTQSASA